MDHIVFEVGIALAVMAIAGVIAVKLRMSTVPFLILAGMFLGPHAPSIGLIDLRFIQSTPLLEFMGRLGVLCLLFYLGLEFSVSRLVKAGRKIAVGGTIHVGLNFLLGLLVGWLMGWPLAEILITAGIMTITSSAIVAKVLVDLKRTANPETEMILGIVMFDDIFLAVYLSIVSGLVLSGATSLGEVAKAAGVAMAFMLGIIVLSRLGLKWINRALNIASVEVFLLVVFALLLLVAGFGETLHVAEAIGALLLGLAMAETAHRERMEHLILPIRDLFGAVFFFSFGLSIDPFSLGGAVLPALIAVVFSLFGNFTAGMLAGITAGLKPRASANIGMSIAARGEFSIVVANLAKAGGLLAVIQPFAALYVLIMAVLGPFLAKGAPAIFEVLNKIFKWQKPQPSQGA